MARGQPSPERRAARFWARVQVSDDGCWLWTGSKTIKGYGTTQRSRHSVYAHRLSFEMAHGPISDGLEIDHLCRTPSCVNPAHLEAVTHAENVRRGRGGAHWAAKTRCPHGHEYTPENTYVYRGRRNCRICAVDKHRAWQRANPALVRISRQRYQSRAEVQQHRNERQRERRRSSP